MALTNDGKRSEKLVHDVLRDFNADMNFCFTRLPDARAARGALAASPADFLFFSKGVGGFIEVKSVAHDYRLPSKAVTQLATLNKFRLAGGVGLILVHHWQNDRWRIVSCDKLHMGAPSWNLTPFETYATPREALLSTGYF